MIIYLSEPDGIHEDAKKLLRDAGHELFSGEIDGGKKKIAEALFIRTYTRADKTYLEQFPGLKYLLRAGVGLDNVDLEECKKRGIRVINAPGSNANAVAEFCVGLIIMLLRHTPRQVKALKNGAWRQKEFAGGEISGKVLGLVGCGAIGRLLTKKLSGFGLKKVIGFDPYLDKLALEKNGIEKIELDNLLGNADIISLHLPLTAETENFIDAKKLAIMKSTAVVINTSRGGIINEKDLAKALKNNNIAGAALDVFVSEPDFDKSLPDIPNLICTPHIAGFTEEANREMSVMPVKKLLEEIRF